ncbi:hypothetical protein HYR99_37620 [Candidatus Poribacteria bacterium]|nr:hypothetical protein [Candidatus Poribacteria bacterium]
MVRYVRLNAKVSFQTRNGWTEAENAIIDTGGPISIIPRRVWQEVRHGFLTEAEIEVLVGGRGTTGRFGQVVLRFHDAVDSERISPPLMVKADLLSDDSYPIVLGFEDVLTDVALYSDYPQQVAYFLFPPV